MKFFMYKMPYTKTKTTDKGKIKSIRKNSFNILIIIHATKYTNDHYMPNNILAPESTAGNKSEQIVAVMVLSFLLERTGCK